MDGQTFGDLALRTESKPERLRMSRPDTFVLLQSCVAMAGIANLFKRHLFYGKPFGEQEVQTAVSLINHLHRMLPDLQDRVMLDADYTENKAAPDMKEPNLRLLHAALGIFTESGEMLEALVATMNGDSLDLFNLAEESGDVDWYQAIIYDELDVSEAAVREAVIAKLKKRYGDKFSEDAAINRDLSAERAVLEQSIAG